MSISKNRVKPDLLQWKCPTNILAFKTTKELAPLEGIVGQDRAIQAIELGAQIKSDGYNVFVSGISGTGRLTTVKRLLGKIAKKKPTLYDYCYVHNFKNPDTPRLLRFSAGNGKLFCQAVAESILFLRRRITQLFEEDAFRQKRQQMIANYQQQEALLLAEFNNKIQPSGFILGQVQLENGGVQSEVFPIVHQKAVHINDIDELAATKKISKKQAEDIKKKYLLFKEELVDLAKTGMKMVKEFRQVLLEFDKSAVDVLISMLFAELKQRFDSDTVAEYFAEMQNDILSNLAAFVGDSVHHDTENGTEKSAEEIQEKFLQYSVNLTLDNSQTKQVPIIVETTPSFINIFGAIEKKYDPRGYWKTDFMQIKAGALFRADQGYLVINALDLLREQGVWIALKRFLLYGKLEIQSVDSLLQMSQTLLKPQPVSLSVKLILIGDAELYHTLYFAEEDFKKMFKVNAEFSFETNITDAMIRNFAAFVNKLCNQEKLLHLTKIATERVIEWAVKHTDSQKKITLQFSDVADVLREANYFAEKSKQTVVDENNIQEALEARLRRNDTLDVRIKERIIDQVLLVDVTGKRVGQINGLTVYDTGLVSFGKPARITATAGVGTSDIVSIEREVELSGNIHDKGVLTITGLFRELFAQKKPMTFSASLSFEQNYGGVDGDSASAAEVISIMSALANIPIRQDLAITGSVNQKGDIQPIGGVTQKVTGFYEICEIRGLTGTQGVVIPIQNVGDLMLSDTIVDAVRQKKFHVYAVKTIDEAVELLTSHKVGKRGADGEFSPGGLYSKISTRLDRLHAASEGPATSKKR